MLLAISSLSHFKNKISQFFTSSAANKRISTIGCSIISFGVWGSDAENRLPYRNLKAFQFMREK
jgi:hypothetical protein